MTAGPVAARLAVISDTHLPRAGRSIPAGAWERMLAADAIVHAGDLVSVDLLDELEALGRPLWAVHGNVDSAEVRARLPRRVEFELGGVRFGVVHDAGPASGRLERMRRAFPEADAVIFGHSHIPMLEGEIGHFQIFNPGSACDRRRQPERTMGVARCGEGRVVFSFVELGP